MSAGRFGGWVANGIGHAGSGRLDDRVEKNLVEMDKQCVIPLQGRQVVRIAADRGPDMNCRRCFLPCRPICKKAPVTVSEIVFSSDGK